MHLHSAVMLQTKAHPVT